MSIEIVQDVVRVIEQLAEPLSPDLAELKVEYAPGGSEVIARLTPTRPTAAAVIVHLDERVPVIDVSLGRGGFFEVPLRGERYSRLSAIDEVRALCLAAVNGKYRETVWLVGNDVIRSRGTVTIGTRDVPIRWAQVSGGLLRRPKRVDFAYDPYDGSLNQ